MLNPYFAFGVPAFLLLLYIIFEFVRFRATTHYLGFILLLISGFSTAFSSQVYQQYKLQPESLPYPVWLLWLPIIIGGLLVLINLIRGGRRLMEMVEK